MSRRSACIGLLLVALAATTVAAAPSQKEQREKLLEQTGLPRTPTTPVPTPPDPTPEDPPDEAPPPATPGEVGTPAAPAAPAPRVITYIGDVHAIVQKHCASCHGPGGMNTGYKLSGERASDYRATLAQVRRSAAASSPLLREAAGEGHGGGVVLTKQSAAVRTLRRWIDDGALYRSDPATTPIPTPAPGPTTPPATTPAPPAGPRPSPNPTVRPTDRNAALVEVASGTQAAPGTAAPPIPAGEPYAPEIHAMLMQRCGACHGPEGGARGTRYVHRGEPATDYPVVRALVDPQRPADSVLVRKAVGERHAAALKTDSPEHRALVRWIEQGAHGPTAASPPSPSVSVSPKQGEPAVDAVTAASPRPETTRLGDGTPLPKRPSPLPFSLPFNLQLNGKLDFSYERRDYRDHPFKAGRNAFATYHHFIYLSRSGAKDPFGFNIELVTRQFYEVNARFSAGRRFRAVIKAGKLLVPFGGEPLYHHSYGGRSGFDQEILPVVWARHGIGFQAQVRLPRGVTLANDMYLIAGHALKAPDSVLALQGDLAALDDVKPAFGDRLGLSWGPLTGWYSLYVSPLGHGRTLVMQAVDLELWRPGKVPFIRDLVPSLGLMRADVSGAGRGEDYYHFGSYWSLSYTPIPYLSLQYRNGLRTHDNRRGVFYDPTRRDANDRGSHNVSIFGRYKGAYVGLQLFWNLEKADERDDDFLRMTVGYAF